MKKTPHKLWLPELKNSPADIKKFERYLIKIISYELTQISKPCYLPKIVKYKNDLQSNCGIIDKDIKLFFLNMPKDYLISIKTGIDPKNVAKIGDPQPKEFGVQDFKVLTEKHTAMILISILFYSRMGEVNLAKLLYIYLVIKFYMHSIHKFFPRFCKDEIWEQALEKMSQKHLFKIKNGHANAILYIANFEFDKYKSELSNEEIPFKILKDIIYYARQKIAQSTRSFASKYYSIMEEDLDSGSNEDTEDKIESDNINLIAEKISNSIATYRQLDEASLYEASMISLIKKDIARDIILDISKVKNKDNIKFIILLINRLQPFKILCTKQKRTLLLKNVLLDNKKIGKHSVKTEILKLVENSDLAFVKNINKNNLVSLLLNYIVLYITKKTC